MSTPPRDIAKVVESILQIIPADQDSLRRDLTTLVRRAGYIAPEVMHVAWRGGTDLLHFYFPAPADLLPWQQSVVDIWSDKA